MGITRATQSPATLRRNINVNRLRRRDVTQVRTLWWFGKQRGNWFRSQNNGYEDLEERLRRHQSLMMHRYSKAMKRRALWDRDHGLGSSMWNHKGYQWEREMSSTESKSAKVSGDENKTKSWQEYHKDFESFKAAVDKAIERDPYGTLFGRKLRSPESSTRTSWTSWSWIFDPKEIKEDPIGGPEKDKKSTGTSKIDTSPTYKIETVASRTNISQSNTSFKTEKVLTSSSSIIYADPPLTSAAGQYVYDPISGRKVLQSPPSAAMTQSESVSSPSIVNRIHDHIAEPSKGGLLRSLFATENGVNIPVKTCKPPKVYGYTGSAEIRTKTETAKEDTTAANVKTFESSRKREYNQLRASILGNSIETAAEYGGKYEPETDKSKVSKEVTSSQPESSESRVRKSPSPDEETPLFTGTTYASRQSAPVKSVSDWLAKEGFRERQGMVMPSLKTEKPRFTRSQEKAEQIQPAIDRTSSAGADIPVKKFSPDMQPAIDRAVATPLKTEAAKSDSVKIPSIPSSSAIAKTEADRREDMDLLRASDVRAAARAARVTKQAMEEKKRKERVDLEKDFFTRQAEDQSLASPTERKTSNSSGLNNIWKHVQQYPTGIVAQMMQSVGLVPTQDDVKQTGLSVQQSPPKVQTSTQTSAIQIDRRLRNLAADLKGVFDEHATTATNTAVNVPPPKAAPSFKDHAKAIRRELHQVSLSVVDIANSATKAVVETRPSQTEIGAIIAVKVPVASEPAAPPVMSSVEISAAIARGCPYIILTYNKKTDDVNVTSMTSLMGRSEVSEPMSNVMMAIASLTNPTAFVKYFANLDKNGYELKSGGGDVLVFQKILPEAKLQGSPILSMASTMELRSTIAAAEAAAQLRTPRPSDKSAQAAKVLNELPTSIPTPGPAAPIAPPIRSRTDKPPVSPATTPLGSISHHKAEDQPQLQGMGESDHVGQATTPSSISRQRKPRSQIRRQEEVFSGQQRLPLQTTSLPDATHFQKQNPVVTSYGQSFAEDQPSLFARFRRTVRRIILTAIAFGVGAYSIGVVAEGIASKAQLEGKSDGPMKRLVLGNMEVKRAGDRQRPGIFSTESSR